MERFRLFSRLLISLSFMILYTSFGSGFRLVPELREAPKLEGVPELEEVFRQESTCMLMSFSPNSFRQIGHWARLGDFADFRAFRVLMGEFIKCSLFFWGGIEISSECSATFFSVWSNVLPVSSACRGLKQSMISPRMRFGRKTPVETSALQTGHLFLRVTYFRIHSEQTRNS